MSSLLTNKLVVQQEQRLSRDSSFFPEAPTLHGVWNIEGFKERDSHRAPHEDVNTAPPGLRAILDIGWPFIGRACFYRIAGDPWLDAWAVEFSVQSPSGIHDRVAKNFSF